MIDFRHYPPLGTAPVGKFQHNPRDEGLPDDPAERFEFRTIQLMNSSGQARTWCRHRVREQFPAEAEAYSASKARTR